MKRVYVPLLTTQQAEKLDSLVLPIVAKAEWGVVRSRDKKIQSIFSGLGNKHIAIALQSYADLRRNDFYMVHGGHNRFDITAEKGRAPRYIYGSDFAQIEAHLSSCTDFVLKMREDLQLKTAPENRRLLLYTFFSLSEKYEVVNPKTWESIRKASMLTEHYFRTCPYSKTPCTGSRCVDCESDLTGAEEMVLARLRIQRMDIKTTARSLNIEEATARHTLRSLLSKQKVVCTLNGKRYMYTPVEAAEAEKLKA